MSVPSELWEPAEAGTLKVGDYIKIDHRWFDHPFERRMFRIGAEAEITTIRDTGLTRVSVDRGWPADGGTGIVHIEMQQADKEAATEDAGEVAKEETARIAIQREALAAAEARDRVTRERAQQLLAMLAAGQAEAATAVAGFVDYLVAILNNSTTPLAPMSPAAPRRSRLRLALLGSDAVWLAGTIGKRLGLPREALRSLTHAAAVHAVGLTRLPPNLADEEPGVPVRGTVLAAYPSYGVQILEQCDGFAPDVLRIVREHRERPDGSGFPNQLRGPQIHPHALILGAVREFQIRCGGSAVAPAVALATIHKTLRATFGDAIVNHLAAAVLLIPVGTYVQLSDGSVACVAKINETARLSPVVDSFGPNAALRSPQSIDLSKREGLFIVRALDTSRLPPRLFDTLRDTSAEARPPSPQEINKDTDKEKSEPA